MGKFMNNLLLWVTDCDFICFSIAFYFGNAVLSVSLTFQYTTLAAFKTCQISPDQLWQHPVASQNLIRSVAIVALLLLHVANSRHGVVTLYFGCF